MSIQDILVYIIVTAALIYTGYSILSIIRKKEQSACGCSSCDFKDNTKDLKKINSIKKIL